MAAVEDDSVMKLEAIKSQVEYYLSDRNLHHDAFFRELVMANPEGWVKMEDSILKCPRMQQLQASCVDLCNALKDSRELEVSNDKCWVRRHRRDSSSKQISHKAKGKGKGARNGASGPEYDSCTPCGYYMAGWCRYGSSCALKHSVPYAMAIRKDWLHAGDVHAQEELVAACKDTIGETSMKQLQVFPRAFSRELCCKGKGTPPASSKASARRWHKNKTASSAMDPVAFSAEDLGVVFADGPAVGVVEEAATSEGLRYLLVLDLEGKDEIIEFPVIVLDTAEGRELGRFQRYVRPSRLFHDANLLPESPAVPFAQVLQDFDCFLRELLGPDRSLAALGADAAFVTCGDWDCKHVHTQCEISGMPVPPAFASWVNIKRTYEDAYGGSFRGMKSMLAKLGLLDAHGNVVHGFHHLGMHDVENICRCVLSLLDQGRSIAVNGRYSGSRVSKRKG
eukprot:gnl/TRDRNA2_/TRDRNA2_155021_c1_seq1.p1 gnl/TRDRNA2_/TRDRNA2_155021_c1~~gnl/TRDRNA2_/TRDRNA2_155021_c1_seq1.p1  ORF type:complete len:451 (+),score=64.29 gnl/TRDRNA2_/TRDRNA2_155021_c1_seq1:69-1421(+)